VKYLRTILVVLLTVLLPMRGAVASAMLCPGQVPAGSEGAAAAHAQRAMPEGQAMTLHHEPAVPCGAHDHADEYAPMQAHDDATPASHAGACLFCAGGCCVAPLAFAPPSVQSPPLASTAAFPALIVRVAAYQSGGQDRPPRSC
jgi:hypothetical protein